MSQAHFFFTQLLCELHIIRVSFHKYVTQNPRLRRVCHNSGLMLCGYHLEVLHHFTFEFVFWKWSLMEQWRLHWGLEALFTHSLASLPPSSPLPQDRFSAACSPAPSHPWPGYRHREGWVGVPEEGPSPRECPHAQGSTGLTSEQWMRDKLGKCKKSWKGGKKLFSWFLNKGSLLPFALISTNDMTNPRYYYYHHFTKVDT